MIDLSSDTVQGLWNHLSIASRAESIAEKRTYRVHHTTMLVMFVAFWVYGMYLFWDMIGSP
jgi:hypothetical protein